MKKISVTILLCLMCIFLVGCGETFEDKMSEMTMIYFCGESGNDYSSISVGEREEPYKKDGITRTKFDFSLICLTTEIDEFKMPAEIIINGNSSKIYLELVSGVYMCDLEYKLSQNDKITLKYKDSQIDFSRQDFPINANQAMEISREHMKEYIKNEKNYECYLKVVCNLEHNEYFWAFTLVGDNGVHNVIIDVENGSIISKD